MYRTGWLLAVSLVVVSIARTEEPAPNSSPKQASVDKLIDKLSDSDFKVREEAARAIEGHGADALPALKRARKHPDPEVRRRVEAWIPALERAGVLAPKRVSLHIEGKTVKEAVKEVARQTGYKIEIYNSNDDKRLISLDFDNLTMWQALDRVAAAGAAVIQHGYGDDTIRLQQIDHHVPFVQHQGAFRIIATGFHLGRSVNFGSIPNMPGPDDNNNHSNSLSFSFSISSEPRLPLLGAGAVQITKAVDDRGEASLLPPENANNGLRRHRVHYWGGHRSSSLSLNAQLSGPDKNARTVKIIEGSVPVTLLMDSKKIELTSDIPAAKGKKFKAGNMNIHVVDFIEKKNQQFEIKLEFVPTGDTSDSWSHTLYNRLEVLDAKGNKFQLYGSSMSQNGKSVQIGFTYGTNGNQGKPTKLIYHDWTTMQHEIHFSFEKLPLP